MTITKITESQPSDVLANLHASADPEREYLFASRGVSEQDLILVATCHDHAIGYIATTAEEPGRVLIWEHVVVPGYRGQGIGRQLLLEVAQRTSPTTEIVIDPMGELALDRVIDYYKPLGFSSQPEAGPVSALAANVLTTLTVSTQGGTDTHRQQPRKKMLDNR